MFLDLLGSLRSKFHFLGRNIKSENITFQGCYLNFDEMLTKFGIPFQYSTLEQFNASVEKTKVFLSRSKADSFVNIGWASQRLNFLANFVSALNVDHLEILDVGGGFGETYLHLTQSTKTKILYDIFEIEKTVEVGNEIFKNYQNLMFYSAKSFSPKDYDLVYFGSSLQYFEDWKAIITMALISNPKYVLISDTTVGDVPTFVCAQVNDPRIVIPRWVFNIDDLDDLFSMFGYTRVLRTSNYYPFHNFYNYEGDYKNIEHANLVFISRK